MMEPSCREINNQQGLASEYHKEKLERKSLRSSFKIKTTAGRSANIDAKIVDRTASAALQFNEKPSTRHDDAPAKPKLNLAKEYHDTRRSYTASRPMRRNNENKRQDESESNVLAASSKTASKDDDMALSGSIQPRHTAKSGYELLGIHRLDDRKYEFGLSDGIRLHLIESIKLCGIRKAREKSITDMIATLCNHLSDREAEINQWTEFADGIVTTAAEKLSQSMLDCEAAVSTVEEYRKVIKTVNLRRVLAREQMTTLKNELNVIKSDIEQKMTELDESLIESCRKLKQGYSSSVETIKSECKSALSGALDDLSRKHNEEKRCMESQICTLQNSIQSEREKMNLLNDRLNAASIAIGEEKHKRTVLQKEFDLERQTLNSEQAKSKEEISRLEGLLTSEKEGKQQELTAMQERMDREFDEIEMKVKRSMKLLVESKNKEIAEALARARDAEQVLSDLKATVIPVISTAEESCEK